MKNSILLFSLVFCMAPILHASDDIEVLKARLNSEYTANIDTAGISALITSQSPDGTWNDVNYGDSSITIWQPETHVTRLRQMAAVYRAEKCSPAQNEMLLKKIKLGLSAWYRINPKSLNWWYNDIGKQLSLGPLGILLEDKLPKDLLDQIISDLADSFGDYTGQNKLWFSEQIVWRGCLSNDLQMLERGADAIKSGIQIYTTEGIMPDFSFRQHGAQLYSGGYGLSFLQSIIRWAYRLRGLDIGLNDAQVKLLRNFITRGTMWMYRHQYIDFQTRGREIARRSGQQGPDFLTGLLRDFAAVDTAERSVYSALVASVSGNDDESLSGDRHFWWSAYHVHRRKNYFFSIHMNSVRTALTERGNDENLKGGYLTDGATTILIDGDEYHNIFPCWNWSRLPGVTCPDRKVPPAPPLWGRMHGTTGFDGAVSDGTYGVAVYDMNHDSTQVKKSWFMFDDEIVCLAACIKSTASDEIRTTLNQTERKTQVWLKETGKEARKMHQSHETVHPEWIWQGNVGYVLPGTPEITVSSQTVRGDWSEIGAYPASTFESKDIVEISASHGLKPSGRPFAYIVVPGVSLASFEKYDPRNMEILENTETLQAVHSKKPNLYGLVFNQPQRAVLPEGLTVSCDHPCVLMLNSGSGDGMTLSVADPTQKLDGIHIEIRQNGKLLYKKKVDLPAGNDRGSSATFRIGY